jgi:hypothetical protein
MLRDCLRASMAAPSFALDARSAGEVRGGDVKT